MRSFLYLLLLGVCFGSQAQYWFGIKVGGQLSDHVYEEKTYDTDSFSVSPDYNFHVGAMMTYQASEKYAVHVELNYQKIEKRLSNLQGVTPRALSKSSYHYLTLPFLLRFNFGRAPFQFYLNGGPRLAFWLRGTGVIELDEFAEFNIDRIDYQIVHNRDNSDNLDQLALDRGNILQYGLTFGGGVNFDLRNKSRIMLDFRYTFGHSHIGFNGSPDFQWVNYYENFEYTHNILSVSVGYLFEFDAMLQRKGKSTVNRRKGG
jgi:hypothetical protein